MCMCVSEIGVYNTTNNEGIFYKRVIGKWTGVVRDFASKATWKLSLPSTRDDHGRPLVAMPSPLSCPFYHNITPKISRVGLGHLLRIRGSWAPWCICIHSMFASSSYTLIYHVYTMPHLQYAKHS